MKKIYETLKETALLENTIIWFISDNGGINAEIFPKAVKAPIMKMTRIWGRPLPIPFFDFIRDNIENGAGDNRPLKGGKKTVYEGGLRVPAFIYAPKFLKQQKINSRITVNDVLSTLAEAVGFKIFEATNLDGVSQWAYLKNAAKAPETIFVTESESGKAYFKKNWKLVLLNEEEPGIIPNQ